MHCVSCNKPCVSFYEVVLCTVPVGSDAAKKSKSVAKGAAPIPDGTHGGLDESAGFGKTEMHVGAVASVPSFHERR